MISDSWQRDYYVVLLAIAMLITIAQAIYAWRRRFIPAALPYTIAMIAVLSWELTYLLEILAFDLVDKFFWAQLQYIGTSVASLSWLVTVLIYTGWARLVKPRNLAILAVIPVLSLILVYTNRSHGLIWQTGYLVMQRGFPMLRVEFGVWAWVFVGYTSLLVLGATGLLIHALQKAASPFREQIWGMLFASIVPLIWSAVYLIDLNPFRLLQLLPAALLAFGGGSAWALLRYRFLELIPVARDLLVEKMGEGVVVLDPENRVIDLNPAAEHIIGVKREKAIGNPIENINFSTMVSDLDGIDLPDPTSIPLPDYTIGNRHYEVRLTYLNKQNPELGGKLVVMRDISQRIQIEKALQRRDAIFQAISFAATRFLRTTSWSTDLQAMLEHLGQATLVSRISIFEKHGQNSGHSLVSLRYEWATRGIKPQLFNTNLQNLDLFHTELGRWEEVFQNGQLIHGKVRQLPNGERDYLVQMGVRSIVLVPIMIDNDWWGYMSLEDCTGDREWNQIELEALEVTAATLSATIQRMSTNQALRRARADLEEKVHARTIELAAANEQLKKDLLFRQQAEKEAAQHVRELKALQTATAALLSTLDLEQLLGQILDAANSAIESSEKGMLHLVARETGTLEMRAMLGYSDTRIKKFNFQASHGYVAKAVREQRPLLLHDVRADDSISYKGEITEVRSIQSAIVAPLVLDGQVIGALSLDSSRPHAFGETNLQLLVSFAEMATTAIHNAQLHAEAQTKAITDSLTGLYNRRGFMEFGKRELESAQRFNRSLAAMILDVDDFKIINDTYGHTSGDLVLQELATRLTENLRKVDLIGRYGGDEFTILLPEADLFSVSQAAERIRNAILEKPVATPSGPLSITISLGIARVSSNTPDLTTLIHQADLALYDAKQSGRNRIAIYRPN